MVYFQKDLFLLVPKQIENTPATKNLVGASVVSKNSLKVITLIAIFFQFLGSNSAVYMVELINALQIVILTVMYPLVMSGNLMLAFNNMTPIVGFDLIETMQEVDQIDVWLSYVFGADGEKLNIRDQIQNMGFGSHNAIANLKTVAVLLFLYIALFTMALLLKLFICLTRGRCGG